MGMTRDEYVKFSTAKMRAELEKIAPAVAESRSLLDEIDAASNRGDTARVKAAEEQVSALIGQAFSLGDHDDTTDDTFGTERLGRLVNIGRHLHWSCDPAAADEARAAAGA